MKKSLSKLCAKPVLHPDIAGGGWGTVEASLLSMSSMDSHDAGRSAGPQEREEHESGRCVGYTSIHATP